MKIIARIIVVLLLIGLIPLFFADSIATRYVIRSIEKQTGFVVTAGNVNVGLLRPVIQIDNLVLTNPPEYPEREAFTVRSLTLRYDRMSLLGREIKINNLSLDIPRIVMVRPEGGGSNIEALAGRKKKTPTPVASTPSENDTAEKPAEVASPPTSTKQDQSARTVVIDELTIRLGEMEVRQYRRDQPEPSIVTIPVDFDRTYSNVTNLETVATQISTELVMKSSFNILSQLGAALNEAGGEDGDAAKKIKDQLKDLKNMFRSGSKKTE